MSTNGFQDQLESVYQQYQHGELEDRLNDVTETMEETILQRILAEAFLQTDVHVDDSAKQAVREAETYLDESEFEKLESELNELERTVEEQERKVNNRIQEERIEMSHMMSGMRGLNERVERVNEAKLDAIAGLLNDWDWKEQVYRNDDAGIETLKERARDYGADMRSFFEEAKDELFGPYRDTPLKPIVDELLNDERFALDDLSDEQIALLRDSDLEEHVELSLS